MGNQVRTNPARAVVNADHMQRQKEKKGGRWYDSVIVPCLPGKSFLAVECQSYCAQIPAELLKQLSFLLLQPARLPIPNSLSELACQASQHAVVDAVPVNI